MQTYTAEESKRIAMRVSWISLMINLLLSAFKLVAGLVASSGAMISDAIHSASDVFSTIIVMIGVQIASRKADQQHQYGHERFESVASVALAIILLETGLLIGWKGLRTILAGSYAALPVPGLLALIAAVVSIVVKEGLYWYTIAAAKRIRSVSLKAEAWHHRSDALSSIGSFAGVLGARLGMPILDPIASIVICLFIFKVAYGIFHESIDRLVDRAADAETVDAMRRTMLGTAGVVRVDDLKTRLFGSRTYVDAEIAVDGALPLRDAHAIAERVHHELEHDFPDVKHCTVHVNPA